ncbi:MAG: hypothetical protein ABJN21_09205 [Paracoccaceae bacterium]
MRAHLEASGFTGFAFLPVTYDKTVLINWTDWETSADMPAKLPAGGEPANYIERGKHAPELLTQMPAVWALHVPANPGLQIEGTARFDPAKAPETDIFRSYGLIWVTARMATFFETHYADWVTCTPSPKTLPASSI